METMDWLEELLDCQDCCQVLLCQVRFCLIFEGIAWIARIAWIGIFLLRYYCIGNFVCCPKSCNFQGGLISC